MLEMEFTYDVAEFTPEQVEGKRRIMRHINVEFRRGIKTVEEAIKTWEGIE